MFRKKTFNKAHQSSVQSPRDLMYVPEDSFLKVLVKGACNHLIYWQAMQFHNLVSTIVVLDIYMLWLIMVFQVLYHRDYGLVVKINQHRMGQLPTAQQSTQAPLQPLPLSCYCQGLISGLHRGQCNAWMIHTHPWYDFFL